MKLEIDFDKKEIKILDKEGMDFKKLYLMLERIFGEDGLDDIVISPVRIEVIKEVVKESLMKDWNNPYPYNPSPYRPNKQYPGVPMFDNPPSSPWTNLPITCRTPYIDLQEHLRIK